jgi:hypothetical protein
VEARRKRAVARSHGDAEGARRATAHFLRAFAPRGRAGARSTASRAASGAPGRSALASTTQSPYPARLNLNAFPITDTDDKLIAAPAIIGDSSSPNAGYSTPAAIGTPSTL